MEQTNNNNQGYQGNQGGKETEVNWQNFYKLASHPIVCSFTVGFKLITLISYILFEFFVSNISYVILTTIILGAIDFWFMKNISGRILVGLRWWNQINEKGEEVWKFESKNEKNMNKADTWTFWTSLYIFTGFWVLCFIWDFIKGKWIWATVCLVVFALTGTNLYAYIRCSKFQEQNIKSFGVNLAKNIGRQAFTGLSHAKNQGYI